MDKEEKIIQKWEKNGVKRNIAVLCTKVDFIHEDVQLLKTRTEKLPGVATRAKMNSRMIYGIITIIVGLAVKVIFFP